MRADDIAARIRAALPDAEVTLEDLTGTADHWKATIVSTAFEGQSLVARHKRIHAALAAELAGPIHALTMETWTPDEAARRRGAAGAG
jgi:stress-induced morphogen